MQHCLERYAYKDEAVNSEHLHSRIIVCQDPLQKRSDLAQELSMYPVYMFPQEGQSEFLIDDAHTIINHAYIATSGPKFFIIAAQKYRHEAQNTLLKLLEEPPVNVYFILIVASKGALLPTIRSRLPVQIEPKEPKQRQSFDLALQKIELKALFEWLKAHERLSKEEAKELLDALFFDFSRLQATTPSRQLQMIEMFEQGYRLLELNSKPLPVFATLLVSLYTWQR